VLRHLTAENVRARQAAHQKRPGRYEYCLWLNLGIERFRCRLFLAHYLLDCDVLDFTDVDLITGNGLARLLEFIARHFFFSPLINFFNLTNEMSDKPEPH